MNTRNKQKIKINKREERKINGHDIQNKILCVVILSGNILLYKSLKYYHTINDKTIKMNLNKTNQTNIAKYLREKINQERK